MSTATLAQADHRPQIKRDPVPKPPRDFWRLKIGRHTTFNPAKPVFRKIEREEETVMALVGFEEIEYHADSSSGTPIPPPPFQCYEDLSRWPEKFERVFERSGDTDGERMIVPVNAEVWNPAVESIEDFANRMRNHHSAGQQSQPQSPSNPLPPYARPESKYPAERLAAMDLKALVAIAEDEEVDLKGIDLKHQTAKAKVLDKLKAELK